MQPLHQSVIRWRQRAMCKRNPEISHLQALPPFLSALVDRLVAASLYDVSEAPNHCLINAYSAGAGIPPHQDGPLYLER